MPRRNDFFKPPDPPPGDVWRGASIITMGALHILDTTRWPRGKPPEAGNAVEVSPNGVTVYELADAMQVAHKLRRGKLTRSNKKYLHRMLRELLGARRYSDKAFNELFERLGL